MRAGPRHPRLGRAVYRLTLRLYEKLCARRGIFRAGSAAAVERIGETIEIERIDDERRLELVRRARKPRQD